MTPLNAFRAHCDCQILRIQQTLRQPIQRPAAPRRAVQAVQHGTLHRYRHYGCRCLSCREASSTYGVEYRKRNQRIPLHTEGTVNRYKNYGCRCAPCREAYAAYLAERRLEPAPNDRTLVRQHLSSHKRTEAA